MASHDISVIAPNDADRCVAVMTIAFADDPACRWMYPDAHQYMEHFPPFVHAFAGESFKHASAHRTGGWQATAMWIPPGVHGDDEALNELLERSIPRKDQDRIFAVFELLEKYHPEEPHWYLPLIGTDSAHQRNGFGSALLSHALAKCDKEHLPAYLEATSPNNMRLYERHGFEAIGRIQAHDSPPIIPMWRKAR